MHFSLSFLLPSIFLVLNVGLGANENKAIIYDNGFKSNDLVVDGVAEIMPNGLLRLTSETKLSRGHAFYPDPIHFKLSPNKSVLSFSTNFVFGIVPQHDDVTGHGLVFVITPTRGLPYSMPSEYLGVFNDTNNGNPKNRVVGVEFDTNQNPQFDDINNNHVGIDINGLKSAGSVPGRYFVNNTFVDISLSNGEPIQVWIEYYAPNKQMDVTLAPINMNKPAIPSLTLTNIDLSLILNDKMYVGFSASTDSAISNSHYILGWSLALNGSAPPLNIPNLPNLRKPQTPTPTPNPSVSIHIEPKIHTIGLPIIGGFILILAICFGVFYKNQKNKKFAEVLEDWESEYGPTHRFKYKDLYVATGGFKKETEIGRGGFGKVYKGTLPESKTESEREIAVKMVSHNSDSNQAMKQFVAEIVSMRQIRHINVVPLLGYCRREGELLVVYQYMPYGSLDTYLHNKDKPHLILDWNQRFKIIKGVASGLFHLHEGCDQIVVHRDIKASNVLLDSELNPRLGDFGLAKLHGHGADPKTNTNIMGTLGYLAPECLQTGRATESSDVFAFGAFLLEVVCGIRPANMLVSRVFGCWRSGAIFTLVDPELNKTYVEMEVEAILKLGLLCSVVEANDRPTMRKVVEYLNKDITVPPNLEGMQLGPEGVSFSGNEEGFNDSHASSSATTDMFFTRSTSTTAMQLSQGR